MHRKLASCLSLIALVSLTGCVAMPSDLDVSLAHASDAKKFVVALQPPVVQPKINQLHSWTIKLTTPDGAPVSQAQIGIDGGMPQHGHGLPTRPRVTRELEAGTYLLEGMKFSMTGWWEIKLAIKHPAGEDTAVFNTIVASPR